MQAFWVTTSRGERTLQAYRLQGNGRIDVLKFPLQIEKVGAMPWQEPRPSMCLPIRQASCMHVAEIRESTLPAIVELRHGRDEPVPLVDGELVRVLSNPDHDGKLSERLATRILANDPHIAVRGAGRSKAPLDVHGNPMIRWLACSP